MRSGGIREADIQSAVADFLNLALTPETFWFHPANEGKRGWKAQWDFKRFGGKAGVPDICIVHAGRAHWIELKAPGARPSKVQAATHDALLRAGCPVAVAYSVDTVEALLQTWGVPLRAKIGVSIAGPLFTGAGA